MKQKKNNKYIFILLALMLLLIPYYLFIFRPVFGSINSLRAENEQLKEDLSDIDKYTNNFDKYKTLLEKNKKLIAEYDARLSFNGKIPPVLSDFKSNSDVNIDEINIKPSEDVKNNSGLNLKKCTVEVKFNATDINRAKEFVKSIEGRGDRFYFLKSVAMTPVYNSNKAADYFSILKYDCRMTVTAYYYGA